jgi:23S rRNA (adenine2503-C2)-methyltransferase
MQVSEDGTEKYLFELEDRETIESVLISDKDRLTLCISSQVGCAMGCRFCLTGKLRLKRNLKAHEIVDQIISVRKIIQPKNITNIVLMGMGEPLANFDNIIDALWKITGYMKISPSRITLSTSGIVHHILDLHKKAPMVNLAVSLNATTDKVRDYLMPVNKKYPLKELLNSCRIFPLHERGRITFEYILLKDINDSPEDAKRLLKLLKGIPSKINLIPFNAYQGAEFERPEDESIINFQNILRKGKLLAFIRKSAGQDILAACGQLKADYKIHS